jgi:FkbM family methyltransferase
LGLNLLRGLGGGQLPNYLLVTPPCRKEQLVRNTRTKETRHYAIRDTVDLEVLHQIFVTEDYDIGRLTRSSDISGTYAQIVAGGKTPLIIDCGANIGLSAAYFSERFPQATIVAIEPEPDNYALAKHNCPAKNVEFLHAAVASAETTGELIDPGLGGWGFRVQERKAGPIRMISINSLLSSLKYKDSEPFIELHDWMLPRKRNSRDFLTVIAGLDRDFVHIGQNVFSITNRPK